MNTAPEISQWRVLVVDDEPDNLDLAADVLEAFGATVARASSGEQALSLVAEFEPALILLDLAMPGMDGWELHRLLRAKPVLDRVPIIALTALAMPEDADRVMNAGFTAYITKPFRVQQLMDELAQHMLTFTTSRHQSDVKEHGDD